MAVEKNTESGDAAEINLSEERRNEMKDDVRVAVEGALDRGYDLMQIKKALKEQITIERKDVRDKTKLLEIDCYDELLDEYSLGEEENVA